MAPPGSRLTGSTFGEVYHDLTAGFIRPGKPVENEFIESRNGKPRDAYPNATQFLPVHDARELAACNTIGALPEPVLKGAAGEPTRFDLPLGEDPATHERMQVISGELRSGDVAVGGHVAISAPTVPRFLERFEEAYGRLGKTETIPAATISTVAAVSARKPGRNSRGSFRPPASIRSPSWKG